MANRYFLNNTTDWNDINNWSSSSGGSSGFSVPSLNDDVFFDSNSGNCSLDTHVYILSFNADNTFINTIDMNEFNFIIDQTTMSYFWLYGGIFNHGSGKFKVNGDFIVDTAQFNQGVGIFDIYSFYLNNSATYNEGALGIICRGTNFEVTGGSSFFASFEVTAGLHADSGLSISLTLDQGGWYFYHFQFKRGTASLILLSNVIVFGDFTKLSTVNTAIVSGFYNFDIYGKYRQEGIYSKNPLSSSPVWSINSFGDGSIYCADGHLDSGLWYINLSFGKVTMQSDISTDNGISGDDGDCHLAVLSGLLATCGYNLTIDGVLGKSTGTVIQKMSPSTITYASTTGAGVIVDVVGCENVGI